MGADDIRGVRVQVLDEVYRSRTTYKATSTMPKKSRRISKWETRLRKGTSKYNGDGLSTPSALHAHRRPVGHRHCMRRAPACTASTCRGTTFHATNTRALLGRERINRETVLLVVRSNRVHGIVVDLPISSFRDLPVSSERLSGEIVHTQVPVYATPRSDARATRTRVSTNHFHVNDQVCHTGPPQRRDRGSCQCPAPRGVFQWVSTVSVCTIVQSESPQGSDASGASCIGAPVSLFEGCMTEYRRYQTHLLSTPRIKAAVSGYEL